MPIDDRARFMRGRPSDGARTIPISPSTEEGEREYLRLRPPRKLTRSQQRYEQYLREDSCMKFGEWLKCQTYKREVAW